MKKLIISSAILITAGTMFSMGNTTTQIKPGAIANTTVAALKLAEAKAALNKPNTKNSRNLLATADGGL